MEIDKYVQNNRLSCNVYGKRDELLIGIGSPFNDHIRRKLESREWHLDSANEFVYDNIVLLDDDFTPIISEGVVDDKYLITKAKKIVDIVLNNPVIFSSTQQIKTYDGYTYSHCNQVACLSVAMGIKMGCDNHQLVNIAIASLTHDIGKCLISKDIINKPGKLTDKEMTAMRMHPIFGCEIMKKVPGIDEIIPEIILTHHENYDGTGYPGRLVGEQITLEASIIHLCDVFDALVSKRSYKKAYNQYDSVNILLSDSGKMFNPKIVDVFSSSLKIYNIGSIIELPDGRRLKIVSILKDSNDNVTEVQFKELNTNKLILKRK